VYYFDAAMFQMARTNTRATVTDKLKTSSNAGSGIRINSM